MAFSHGIAAGFRLVGPTPRREKPLPQSEVFVTPQKVRGKAIFMVGDLACFFKALYQNGPVSDLAVVGYLGFTISKRLVCYCQIAQNPKYPATLLRQVYRAP